MDPAPEIEELHRFFQAWFRAELPPTDAAFARFEAALAPDFLMITPSGASLARAEILASVRAEHGTWARDPGAVDAPANAIRIADVRVRLRSGDLVLATYEEWHLVGGEETCRVSSALFRAHADAPGGLLWLHLHETRLAAG